MRCWNTDSFGKPRATWKVRTNPRRLIASGDRPAISRPSKRIEPLSVGTRPETTLKSVVFPAPLRPMRPMMPPQRARAAGLNTAGYISGYRGSPLGGFDQALWQAKRFIKNNHIEFQPGVNEDLAATALWGTQQIHLYPGARYDGVFGMWYGKGPGVDRSGDVLKHANYAGTSRHGGVVALAGDDHMAKSSTTAHQSEPAFMAAGIPVIHPASVQEYLDFGLHAFAMSRYSGLWVAFKVLSETVDSSASVHVDPHRIELRTPTDFVLPPDGVHIRC